jgi:capsular exopolysaccharide synthesis family protein
MKADGTELGVYLQLLLRAKLLIFVSVLAAIGIVLAYIFSVRPQYAATTTIRVLGAPGAVEEDVWRASALATRLMNTYVEIATSRPMIDTLVEKLELHEIPGIEVEVVPETELIRITTMHQDPLVASRAANTLAQMLVDESLQLYAGDVPSAREILETQVEQTRIDLDVALNAYEGALRDGITGEPLIELSRLISIRQDSYADRLERYEAARVRETLRSNAISVIEPALTPQNASSPKPVFLLILGVFGGLTAGVGFVFIRESLDDTLGTVEQAEQGGTRAILGTIPQTSAWLRGRKQSSMLPWHAHEMIKDAYHRVAFCLLEAEELRMRSTILISSAEPGAGKSTAVMQLGLGLSQAGRQTLVVDGNLRSPRLHHLFGVPNLVGLSNVLAGEVSLRSNSIIQDIRPNLQLLSAGTRQEAPRSLISVSRLREVLDDLTLFVEYVLIDTPCLLSATETSVFASEADAVILVAAIRQTRCQDLDEVLSMLGELNIKPTGMIINRVPRRSVHTYYLEKPRLFDFFRRRDQALNLEDEIPLPVVEAQGH